MAMLCRKFNLKQKKMIPEFRLKKKEIESFVNLLVAEMPYKKIDDNTVEYHFKGDKKLTKRYAHTIKVFTNCFGVFNHSLTNEDVKELRVCVNDVFGKFSLFNFLDNSFPEMELVFKNSETNQIVKNINE